MMLTKDGWLRAGRWMRWGTMAMALAAALVQAASAQAVSTTTVQGTVYLANGQPGAGTLVVSWPAFTTAAGQSVTADRATVTIPADGFVSVNLAPNQGATPAGQYYTAVFYMSDGTVSTQYWVVPAAAQATLAQVQAQVMPAAQAVQAVSKSYVDQAVQQLGQTMLAASGGTLNGPLTLTGDPTQPLQAADKHYVDTQVATAVPLAGGNMTGAVTTPAVNGVQAPATGSAQTTLQAAINAAGTNGAMEIPPTYTGTDTFTNANGVRVTDLRTAGAQQTTRSVKEFGAVCDGVTDDTNALQAALNYANAHGVALTIPEGVCKTHALSWRGESIGGMGKQVSALMGFPGQDVLESPADATNLLSGTRIHDLTIYVDQSEDVSCVPAEGRAAAGSCQVSRPMESNSIFSPGGNGLTGTAGTGAAWSVGNCAIAMPAATGAGGNGLRVAEIENVEIAATGTDPMAAQYPGAHSTHTCGMYLAQWPQWSDFRNIDIRGLNTGIAIPALPVAAPAGLTADSNRWQNVTIQATHAFTAAAGSNNVLDNVVAQAGNSAATGEPPTGLVLDLPSGQQGWTVRSAVVTPTWNAVQPQLTVTVAGGSVTGVTAGAERGLGWDPYGATIPLAFSGSCTAQATAAANSNGSIGAITVMQGGVGCSATTTASVNAAGTWDTAAPVNLIGGQNMTLFAGNLLKGNGGYTVWNATGSASYGTQLDGGGGALPGGGQYAALAGNSKPGATLQVDQFPGADFGAKLQACLSAVNASYGGTCDARNFTGNQSMGSNLTISTGNTAVLLPCATITTANQIVATAGTRNVSLRGCALRGGTAASGSQGGTVFAYTGATTMVQVGDATYATDTPGFHMDNAAINTTGAASGAQGLVAYRTQELDLESLYFLGNQNQTGMTLDGTGNYTGGTFLDDQLSGFGTAVNAIGHQAANPATTDWMNASTFVRLHIDCPTSSGNPIGGTYGINLQQGDGNTFTGGDVEGCSTALHLGPNAENNTIVGLRNENSTNQVVADEGSAYNDWMTGGTMFTGKLTDNGTRNSFLDTFHRSFNGLNGDWYGSQQDATVTNHFRLGTGTGNERGLLNRYQTDYGYRWTTGLSDATGGEQFYQILDELNNVYRVSIGQYLSATPNAVTNVIVNNGGCYSSSVAPTVVVSGGGGSGASATASMTTTTSSSCAGGYTVGSVTMTSGGSGYTTQPAVSFTGSNQTAAPNAAAEITTGGSTNNQTVLNAAGTGAVVLNGSNNAGTGGVVFGSGGPSETTIATISNAGDAQFNGTLQVGGTAQTTGTMTVRNSADAEVDYYLWPGLTTSQKGSFTYKDWNGNSQWYMVKDASNNWALNSAVGGLDSFKAYQSTNSGDTYIDASNSTGHIRLNYESGAGAETDIYSGSSASLVAAFLGPTSIKLPGLAAGSGDDCLQIDNSGYITNTGAACSTGVGTVGSGGTGQIAYYTGSGTSIGGESTVPLAAGGTGAATAAGALANLGGIPATGGTMSGPLTATQFNGPLSGNATTATALAAMPTQCASGSYATGVTANGTANCTAVSYTQVSGTAPTWNQNTTGTAAGFTSSLSGDVTGTQTATVVGKINGASVPASAALTGTNSSGQIMEVSTVPASSEPAHTGDVTNAAGSLAMTVQGVNGTVLSGLATGLVKNTTGTGVPSIAVPGTDYVTPSGSIAGTAGNVSGTVQLANGGTGAATAAGALANLLPGVTADGASGVGIAGNAQLNGTLQVGGAAVFASTPTVKNQANAEVDATLWAGLTASQKESFSYKDWNGNNQWYMLKDANNNWALNSAVGGLDSFKAFQSTNSGDTYLDASNATGAVRVNYETGSGTGFDVYGGNSGALLASIAAPGSVEFPGLAAGNGHSCLQVDSSGFITNTGSACGSGTDSAITIGSAPAGQVAYYSGNGSSISGMGTVPVTAGGTGAATAAEAMANLLPGVTADSHNGVNVGGAVSPSTVQPGGPPVLDIRNPAFDGGAICNGSYSNDILGPLQAAINALPSTGGVIRIVGTHTNWCYLSNPNLLIWNNSLITLEISGMLNLGATFTDPQRATSLNFVGNGSGSNVQFGQSSYPALIYLVNYPGAQDGTLGTTVSTTPGVGVTVAFTPPGGIGALVAGDVITVAGTLPCNISSISRSGGLVTAVMTAACHIPSGILDFTVAGVTDSSYDGTFGLKSSDYNTNTMTWVQTGGNSSSSGGTVVGLNVDTVETVPISSCTSTTCTATFYRSHTASDTWSVAAIASLGGGENFTGIQVVNNFGSPLFLSESYNNLISRSGFEGLLPISVDANTFLKFVNDAIQIPPSASDATSMPWSIRFWNHNWTNLAGYTADASIKDSFISSEIQLDYGATGLFLNNVIDEHPTAAMVVDDTTYTTTNGGIPNIITIDNSQFQDTDYSGAVPVIVYYPYSGTHLGQNTNVSLRGNTYVSGSFTNDYFDGHLYVSGEQARQYGVNIAQGVQGILTDGIKVIGEFEGEGASLGPSVIPYATANINQNPSSWSGASCTITPGGIAPDGAESSMVGAVTSTGNCYASIGGAGSFTPHVGDYVLWGGYTFSPSFGGTTNNTGGYAIGTSNSAHFLLNGSSTVTTGRWDSGVPNDWWHPLAGIATVTASDGTTNQSIELYAVNSSTSVTQEFWMPFLIYIPAIQFTGTTDGSTAVITLVSSFTGLQVGQTISGSGIPANAYITALNRGSATVMISAATTTTGSGVSLSAQVPYQLVSRWRTELLHGAVPPNYNGPGIPATAEPIATNGYYALNSSGGAPNLLLPDSLTGYSTDGGNGSGDTVAIAAGRFTESTTPVCASGPNGELEQSGCSGGSGGGATIYDFTTTSYPSGIGCSGSGGAYTCTGFPTNSADMCHLIIISGGAGGGSGATCSTGSTCYGGGGGSGAGEIDKIVPCSTLGSGATSTVTVTVGTGGAGGTAQAGTSASGNSGSGGTVSSVIAASTSYGGFAAAPYFQNRGSGSVGGSGGTATAGSGGSVSSQLLPNTTCSGGNGSSGTPSLTGTICSGPNQGPWGGAGGGGLASGTTAAGGLTADIYPPMLGSRNIYGSTTTGGAAGGGNGQTPNPGSLPLSSYLYGAIGGSGGGSNCGGNGGAGGTGMTPGGGGAGGGAACNGSSSGAGGAGGNGFVEIIVQ